MSSGHRLLDFSDVCPGPFPNSRTHRVSFYAPGQFQLSVTPTNTLTHLDGLAIGSLIALGLRTIYFSRRMLRRFAVMGLLFGVSGVVLMIFHGSRIYRLAAGAWLRRNAARRPLGYRPAKLVWKAA